jgi:DNA-binding MarR family transcriptional regulator/predicted GNAT family acetyltransferase
VKGINLIGQLGELAFLSRLRRLCECLSKDAKRIYTSQGVDFEARWFPVTYLLKDRSAKAVTEVASALGMTHPSVNQIANAMAKRGLLSSSRDKFDERKRLLSLTPKGLALVRILEPIWREIADATSELLDSTGLDVLQALARIEDELERSSIYERVMNRVKTRQRKSVEVLDYKPVYKKHFKSLNSEWLEEYDWAEPLDDIILSDPNGMILKKGGQVFFARLDGQIVGTCAILKINDKTFELTKMAVTHKARGRQAGRKLAEAAIERVRSAGAKSVILETSTRLIAAVALYRKLGFVQIQSVNSRPSKYRRPSIMMKLDLEDNRA